MPPEIEHQIEQLLRDGNDAKAIALLRETENLRLVTARERITDIKARLFPSEPQDAAYIFSSIGQFVLLCVVGLSGFLTIPSALNLLDYSGATQWPTTTGTVIDSGTFMGGVMGTDGPRIEYEYQLSGHNYRSTRWGFPPVDAGLGSSTKEVLRRYPEGATVTVHYHPTHPERAIIEPSLTWQWVRVLTLLISLPLYLWYRGFHSRVIARSQARMAAK